MSAALQAIDRVRATVDYLRVGVGTDHEGEWLDCEPLVTDPEAPYFGARIDERTLMPVDGVQVFETTLDEWLPANPPRS